MRAMSAVAALGLSIAGLLAASAAVAQGWPAPTTPQQPQPAPQPSAVGQPQPPPGGLEAGGLAPPPPITVDPNRPTNQSATESQLQVSEKKDSGRGLEWFYLNAEGGFQALGLKTFKDSQLTVGNVKTSAMGGMAGVGLGVRLMFFTLGARARMGFFQPYQLVTVNGELGAHLPLGDFEPYITLGGGYAMLTSLKAQDWEVSSVSVRGYDIRIGGGFDYYVTPVFSVGANLTGEMLGLFRPAATPLATSANKAAAMKDGSSIGASLTIAAVAGLHF